MSHSRAHHWTYADYLRLPDEGPRYEIYEGILVKAPAPLTRHQIVSGNLYGFLWTFVRERALGRVLDAPCDVIFADDVVLQPDLLFVAESRRSIIKERGVFGAPDLVVEILSRSSAERDAGQKADLYSKHGVAEYWIVDPDEDRIEVFLLEGGRLVRRAEHASGEVRSLAAVPGFSAPLAEIFERGLP
jgi:Uma2 family endonuclease